MMLSLAGGFSSLKSLIKNAASYKTMRQIGGLEGDRTLDLSDANRTLSQLSYEPMLLT